MNLEPQIRQLIIAAARVPAPAQAQVDHADAGIDLLATLPRVLDGQFNVFEPRLAVGTEDPVTCPRFMYQLL